MAKRVLGKVVQFDPRAGWGFVERDAQRYFVHTKDISRPASPGFPTLCNGQLVSFEIAETEKGLRARNLEVLA